MATAASSCFRIEFAALACCAPVFGALLHRLFCLPKPVTPGTRKALKRSWVCEKPRIVEAMTVPLPGAFRPARRICSLGTELAPRIPSSPPDPLPQVGEGRFLNR